MSEEALVLQARAAQRQAYAPYSNFQVGAALEALDGTIYIGCNVENASYGLTNCAERVAIGAAVSAGRRRFRKIVIVSDSDPPAAPCGACRQVLLEFGAGLLVEAIGPKQTQSWVLQDLIPASFSAEQLRPHDKVP
jgi:cytidine deaminase